MVKIRGGTKFKKVFTLIELIVVIAIIAILSAIVTPNAFKAIEKAKVSRAMADSESLRAAAETYYADVGFWPPDVNRGYDPGFTRTLPYNPDTGDVPALNPSGYPENWEALAQAYWEGPYIEKWPNFNPWAGKYDWNYWPIGATRYGVSIPAGCYVGIQGDYNDNNHIPEKSERILVNKGFDADGQVNGESQLLMVLIQ